MFLDQAQLCGLTGRKRKDGQKKWLAEHGYKFEVNALGRPVVLVSAVEARLGGKLRTRVEPKWELLGGQKAA